MDRGAWRTIVLWGCKELDMTEWQTLSLPLTNRERMKGPKKKKESKVQMHTPAFLVSMVNCSTGKESTCNAGAVGDVGSVPGSERSPGGGHGNQLQHSCLENSMDRGAWQATVHGVAKSRTRAHTHTLKERTRELKKRPWKWEESPRRA